MKTNNIKTELTVEDLKMIWMLLKLLKAKHLKEGGSNVHNHDELGNKVWQVLLETLEHNKTHEN